MFNNLLIIKGPMSFVQVEMILQALEYEMGRLFDELICSASMAFLIQN
jgi:hypothetical protein